MNTPCIPSPPARIAPPAAPDYGRPDLAWVDEFIARVRPFIFVRATDGLLIKRPNQAQQLNQTGVQVLQHLLNGGRIGDLLDRVGHDPVRTRQIGLFLLEVKRFLEGTLTPAQASEAVVTQPLPLNFSAWPVLAEVAITYRCDLQCRFCYAGCGRPARPGPSRRELTSREIRTVLDKIWHEAQVPSVSFTGGEPTLRTDLPELIAHAKQLGMRVNLITNGTRIGAPQARQLAQAGLDSAQVSIEAAQASIHDAITGAPGSFARSVAAVGHLAQAGIRVHTNTTLNRVNLPDSHQIPAWIKHQLGRDRFSMNLVIPAGSARTADNLSVRYDEIGPVLERIQSESRRQGVEFMWYSPTPLCIFNPIPRGLGNKGCAACDGLLSVAPDGSVLPCSSWPEPVGHLLRQSFTQIWQSNQARRLRAKQRAHPACHHCAHLPVCHGACPLYWEAHGYAELPAAHPRRHPSIPPNGHALS